MTTRVFLLEKEIVNLRKSYDKVFSLLRSIFKFLQYTDESLLMRRGLELFEKVLSIKEKALFLFDEDGVILEAPGFSIPSDVETKFKELEEEGIIDWVMDNDSPFPVEEKESVYLLIPVSFRMKPIAVIVVVTDMKVEEITEQVFSQVNIIRYGLAANIANIRLYNEVVRVRDYLYNILENLTNGVVVVDRNGKVFLVNHVAEKLLNLSKEKSFFDVFPEEVSSLLMEAVVDAASSGGIVKNEFELGKEERRELFIAFSCKYLEHFDSFLFVFRDITESKEMERIKEIDRLKNQFVSNVSHDLRTPLTGIKAFTEILLDSLEDMTREEIKDGLITVKNEADRLTEMVNDLLDFSRIENRMMALQMEDIDLVELWKEVIKVLEGKMSQKGIELKIDFPGEALLFRGDRKKMHRVLLNLLGNAVKYNFEGGKIWIAAGKDDGFIWFEIGNTGYVIEDEDLPYIFDSFYVGKLKIGISDERSGIGLAVVKRIVEAHDGSISVRSSNKEGTVFTVRIPREGRDGNEG